jgi:hypothetical protein
VSIGAVPVPVITVKVEHIASTIAVALGQANILRTAPGSIEQGLSKHLGVVCRQAQARTEYAGLVTAARMRIGEAVIA